MKKTNVTFSYDAEKLATIRMYMTRKEVSLEDDLAEFLDRQYEKFVPKDVRDYLMAQQMVPAKTEQRAQKAAGKPAPAEPQTPRPEGSGGAQERPVGAPYRPGETQ